MWWLILFALILLIIVKLWPKALWLVLVCAALLLAGVIYWQQKADEQLTSVGFTVVYDTALCSAERPLSITISNEGKAILDRVLFRVHAQMPGYSGEITPYTYKQYDSNRILEPGESYAVCYQEPPLSRMAREKMSPTDLEWSAEAVKVFFR